MKEELLVEKYLNLDSVEHRLTRNQKINIFVTVITAVIYYFRSNK
ncbi:MAG: hypothetical protein ACI4RR_02465 [Eubacterium sp.]